MEPTHGKHKASKSASEDIISRMPDNVITHILDRLPIQYAVRTCILSRNWRFKWTLLSNVVFDKKFFEYSLGIVAVDWLGNIAITSSLVFHLVCHFPKLQDLYLDLRNCKFLEESGSTKWVSTSFHCLRLLMLYPIDFNSDVKLSFAFDMIWGLPELQTLMITAVYNDAVQSYTLCSSSLNHISMGQLKLCSVVFKSFRAYENEIYLIKKLLDCSPLLKKIDIYPSRSLMCGDNDRKLMLTKKLLKLQRASSAAEANIYWS
ncbi:putative F-box/FBD/LRR-repeat protein At4g13965 [Rutidosis leptorrhynchoides]|uniref:putative F-box/FBD/LRR-repeat protein At4g13965 n=1 Tax=Rutidosis leptorrhynchoides TaxID=125765 RepID=UPI003A9A60D3